jgi:hypothetical protein
MIKYLLRDTEHNLAKNSKEAKIFIGMLLIVYGSILYLKGLDEIIQNFLLYVYLGFVVNFDNLNFNEAYRLLPLSDREIKCMLVLGDVMNSVITGLALFVFSIPYIIKTGDVMVIFSVICRIAIPGSIYALFLGGINNRSRYLNKGRMRKVVIAIDLIFGLVVVAFATSITESKLIIEMSFILIALAVIITMLRLYRLKNISVEEMDFSDNKKKK